MQSAVHHVRSRSWRDIVFAPAGLRSHARGARTHVHAAPTPEPISAGVRAAIDAVMPLLGRPQADVVSALDTELERRGCAVEVDLARRIAAMLAAPA